MVVVSDGRDIDAVVANMLIATIKMGTSLIGVFISLQVYRHFPS